jgi:hypothetical protein
VVGDSCHKGERYWAEARHGKFDGRRMSGSEQKQAERERERERETSEVRPGGRRDEDDGGRKCVDTESAVLSRKRMKNPS